MRRGEQPVRRGPDRPVPAARAGSATACRTSSAPSRAPARLGATIRGGVVQRAEVSTRGGEVVGGAGRGRRGAARGAGRRAARRASTCRLGDYRLVATRSGDTISSSACPRAAAQDVLGRLVVDRGHRDRLALLGGGFAGAVLVRRELRPLERVAATAARVSALPLDRGEVSLAERVPDVDPRTEVGQVGARAEPDAGPRRVGAWRPARTARSGCGSSSPTPATSCAPRSPRSAATPS